MQGPGEYAAAPGLGKQVVSTRPTSAFAVFGSAPRDPDASGPLALGGTGGSGGPGSPTGRGRSMTSRSRRPASPGPAEYDVDAIDALGKGTTSGRPRSASTRIGTARRFRPASSMSPGPAYNPEMTPVRGRAPAYSFGTDPRDPPGSRPRSAGAATAGGAAGGAGLGLRPQSPGPGAYEVTINGLGQTTTSTHARSPIAKFPLADRFAAARPSSPAPGAYGTPPMLRFPSPPRAVMGSAPRSASVKLLSPAPGTYDVMAAVKSVRPRSAQPRFGTCEYYFSSARSRRRATATATSLSGAVTAMSCHPPQALLLFLAPAPASPSIVILQPVASVRPT